MNPKELEGIELLRYAVRLFNDTNETIGQTYSATQLLSIAQAHRNSGWDIYPDHWTSRQLRDAAFRGKPPMWEQMPDGTYEPVYK